MIFTHYRPGKGFYIVEVYHDPVETANDFYFKIKNKIECGVTTDAIEGSIGGTPVINPIRGSKAHFSMSQAVRYLVKEIFG